MATIEAEPMPGAAATFSPCGRYRYDLWRRWDMFNPRPGYVLFIGLNPSTATATVDDPTIRRCIKFARRWGFSAYCMANLFAWRDTDPRKMKLAADPVGPENDHRLANLAAGAGLIVCAWGAHGGHRERAGEVVRNLRGLSLQCLGTNANGSPKHPLYLSSLTLPRPFPV